MASGCFLDNDGFITSKPVKKETLENNRTSDSDYGNPFMPYRRQNSA
jgi:hypothetical protein